MGGHTKNNTKNNYVVSTEPPHPSILSSKLQVDKMNKVIFNMTRTLKSFLQASLKCTGRHRLISAGLLTLHSVRDCLLSLPVLLIQWLFPLLPSKIHIWETATLCANTYILVPEEICIFFVNISFYFYLRSFSHLAKKRKQDKISRCQVEWYTPRKGPFG